LIMTINNPRVISTAGNDKMTSIALGQD